MLTFKQRVLLQLIELYIKENGYSPSVRELAELYGVKSSSTMQVYLDRLEKQGYISRHETMARTIKILKSADY